MATTIFMAEYLSLMISSLEKLLGSARDGALLRYSLGLEYTKAGDLSRAAQYFRDAVERDALYSAAWKALGRALQECGRKAEALEAYQRGIEAARAKGDRQAEKEMTVFMRRLEKAARAPGQDPQ
jgi:tetratricopeptide (TPR) repeat protein